MAFSDSDDNEPQRRPVSSKAPPRRGGAGESAEASEFTATQQTTGTTTAADAGAGFDFGKDQTKLDEPDGDTMRIMLSTDNHLGYEENDEVVGMDSFAAFEEVLYLAKRFQCDMVLLAGDLFHENRPSRRTLFKTMDILRRYTMGQEPVQIQILGDPEAINYLNPNVSVDLPIFSIHGNHDDPTRDGGDLLAALDLLHVNLLVNYFGRQSEVSQVQISPVLLQKGATRLALYGLGALREERLHRMWREGKVAFLRPEAGSNNNNGSDDDEEDDNNHRNGDDDGFFNIFALHQNRDVGRGSKNCVQESMIPEWMDVVVWGHEHECQIEFTESVLGTYRISQPGSSVATSLVSGEAVIKKVGIMDVRGRNFRLHPVPLTQIRPFVTTETILAQHKNRLDPEDNHVDSKVTRALEEEVQLMILKAQEKHDQVLQMAEEAGSNVMQVIEEHNGQESPPPVLKYKLVHPQKVLVRARVEHSGFSTLNNQRFGAKFVDEVANSDNILLFHRKKSAAGGGGGAANASTKRTSKAAREAMQKPMEPEELEGTHMDDLVRDFLELPNQQLSLLEEKTLSEAMEAFVEKQSTQAIPDSTHTQLRQKQKILITNKNVNKGSDVRQAVEESQHKNSKKDTSQDGEEDDTNLDASAMDEEEEEPAPKGRRKKATTTKATARKTTTSRRRAASMDEDDDDEVDDTVNESSRGVSMLDDDDDEEEEAPPPKRKRATAAKSRTTAARGRRKQLDDDDDVIEVEEPTPARKARATSRRTTTKRKVNYSMDDSDAGEEDDNDAFVSRMDEDDEEDDDEVMVVDPPPKKRAAASSRARATTATTGRKKRATTATTTASTRKTNKRSGRYMESDNEDEFGSGGKGGSSTVLDDDWGSAATRSQL